MRTATIIGIGKITKTAAYVYEHSFGLNFASPKYTEAMVRLAPEFDIKINWNI